MPQNAWSEKRERQYAHIRDSLRKHGKGEALAEEIAGRTVWGLTLTSGRRRPDPGAAA